VSNKPTFRESWFDYRGDFPAPLFSVRRWRAKKYNASNPWMRATFFKNTGVGEWAVGFAPDLLLGLLPKDVGRLHVQRVTILLDF